MDLSSGIQSKIAFLAFSSSVGGISREGKKSSKNASIKKSSDASVERKRETERERKRSLRIGNGISSWVVLNLDWSGASFIKLL